MTVEHQRHYEQIEPSLEIANIRVAADIYEERALQHGREVIRLNRLARNAREMANKLEGITS